MFRWNDMYIYNIRIVGETNSKQTLKRRRAHDGSFESQSRQDWSTDRGVCSTIANRIKRRTVRGYQPFGQCVYTYIYVYIRKTWARWQKTGSLRTYVRILGCAVSLEADSHDFYGMSRVPATILSDINGSPVDK